MGTIRFGAAVDEPLRVSDSYKLRSGRRGDLYLLNRKFGDEIKISLHPGLWKIEHTSRGGGRQTIQPPEAVRAGTQPAIRILVGRGSATEAVETLPEKVAWVLVPDGHDAVEFQILVVPSDRVRIEMGSGFALVDTMEIGLTGHLALVVAEAHEHSPVSTFEGSIPEDADGFDRALTDVEQGDARASWWTVGEGVVFILDRVHLRRT